MFATSLIAGRLFCAGAQGKERGRKMSDDRKKIKDLATELGIANKDVLAAAKDLSITAAKVAGSSLSETEVARLRAHFSPPEPEKQQVIVRRKRTPRADSVSSSAAESEKQAPVTAAGQPSATERVSDFQEQHPESVEAPKEAETTATVRSVPEKKSRTEQPVQAARIVKRVDEPETAPEAPAGQAEKPPVSGAEEERAAVAESARETTAAPDEKETPQGEAQTKPSPRSARPAAFSAEPERGADGQAVSSAPHLPPRSEFGPDLGHEAQTGEQGIERKNGQTGTQVRIISRPDARQQPRPQTQERRSPASQQPRPQEGQSRAPGGYRPRSGPGTTGGPAPRQDGRGAPTSFAPSPSEGEQGRKKRQKGRRTVEFTALRGRTDEDAAWSKSSRRGKARKQREVAPMGGTQPIKAVKRKIKVDEFIRVSDLAHQMQLKSGEIIKVLFNLGVMATINQSLDIDTATLVANEFGYDIEKVGFSEEDFLEALHEKVEDNPEDYVPRPPVVTIMGHVDHGKTSLLDAIRKSSVVTGEAGGITQHIGAYHVKTKKGEIVFLDTPGHEAFTAMRARGAEVTDIVVLVVAADDGVMEQTREAINHSRAANVPIMVAVNKMDKEGANPDRVKRELAEQGLVAEDWGGNATFSYVSAKTREGLDELLELLALQAEILELKANPKRPALGHIVEAKLDKGRGALGTVLIQQGTLHLGDAFVCGVHSGRVRAMFDDQGKKVKEAGPSMPVEVQGFEGVPEAGEEFICIADEKQARRIAEARALKQRERELANESKITLETFLARKADSVEAEVLNLVVKSDVQGSLEAITDALRKLDTDKARINVIHGGTGAISESDVLLASASNAIIIGFNVRPAIKAKELAEQEKVDIRFYDIIYKLVEEIKSAMEGLLAPVSREVFLGSAEVREIFSVPKIGTVAGSHVADGKIVRNAQVRLLRDGVVVHTGKIASLRRFKDDVREVSKGYECGIGLENYNDIKPGDVIEAFEVVEEAATL